MIRALALLAVLLVAAIALPPLWFRMFPVARPELPPAGRRVEVSPGVGVNVIEAGAGPAVLLVHGHPGCAYEWQPFMAELAQRGFRAIAYDRVGYGRSDPRPTPGPVVVESNANELLSLLEALDLRDVTLVGFSYGGATSIVAAKRDATRLARLVLVASVGPGIETTRPQLPAPVVELLAGPVLSWIGSVPPVAARARAAFLTTAFAPAPVTDAYLRMADANFARPHTLRTYRSEGRDLGGVADLDPSPLQLPILIVQGDGDRLVPPVIAKNLHARAPHAQLVSVPGAGHGLPVSHAALLADAVSEFARAR